MRSMTKMTAGTATPPVPASPPEALPPPPELDPAALREPVRLTLGAARAEVTAWTVEPVHGGLDKTSAVYRLRGTALAGGERREWSLILKVFRPAPGRDDPQGAFYWRREALAYTSGILGHLPEGFRAARCYGVQDRGDALWMWLEYVEGAPGQAWSREQTLQTVRRLGAFSGAYAAGCPLPSFPWLPPSWHRAWAAATTPYIARLIAEPDHPLVRAGWPDDLYPAALRFWEEDLPRFLEAMDRLPQTLQHGDPSGRNLFWSEGLQAANGETVAIDWSWLNVSAVGFDLSTLVNFFASRLGSATDATNSIIFAPEAEREAPISQILETYAAGMRDAGWQGETALVRLGYLLATAERYLAHPLMLAYLDEAEHALAERGRGMPMEEFMHSLSRVVRRGLGAATAARALLEREPLP